MGAVKKNVQGELERQNCVAAPSVVIVTGMVIAMNMIEMSDIQIANFV